MTVRPPMSSARRRRGRDRRVPRYRFLCRRRLSSLARRVRRRPGQCSGSSTPRLDARFHRTRVRPLRSRFVTSRRLARRATNDPTARRTAPAGRRSPSRLAPCATGDVRSCAAAGPRLLDSLRPPFRSFDRTAADSSVRRRPFPGASRRLTACRRPASVPGGSRSGHRTVRLGRASDRVGRSATVPAAPHPATCASARNTVPRWRSCPSSARTASS